MTLWQASLLDDMHADVINLKPTADSSSPERDMAVVRQWLHAVAESEEHAPRFTLKEVRACVSCIVHAFPTPRSALLCLTLHCPALPCCALTATAAAAVSALTTHA
jgi:hypothetical protein